MKQHKKYFGFAMIPAFLAILMLAIEPLVRLMAQIEVVSWLGVCAHSGMFLGGIILLRSYYKAEKSWKDTLRMNWQVILSTFGVVLMWVVNSLICFITMENEGNLAAEVRELGNAWQENAVAYILLMLVGVLLFLQRYKQKEVRKLVNWFTRITTEVLLPAALLRFMGVEVCRLLGAERFQVLQTITVISMSLKELVAYVTTLLFLLIVAGVYFWLTHRYVAASSDPKTLKTRKPLACGVCVVAVLIAAYVTLLQFAGVWSTPLTTFWSANVGWLPWVEAALACIASGFIGAGILACHQENSGSGGTPSKGA